MRAAATRRWSLRAWLSAGLVGLMLIVSGAPCTGLAAPARHAVASVPADPCKQRAPATPCCCVQAACQSLLAPLAAGLASALQSTCIDFDQVASGLMGQRVPPPTPPPRASMS